MDDRNLQHSDITTIERTGHPAAPYNMQVEIGTEVQRAYVDDRSADFIDWCFADPDIIKRYLDETNSALHTWIKEVLSA